jgi:hypothetical protein
LATLSASVEEPPSRLLPLGLPLSLPALPVVPPEPGFAPEAAWMVWVRASEVLVE